MLPSMRKSKRAQRRSRDEWRVLVGEWKVSGAPAREFADRRGLSASSLLYWSSVLRREAPARPLPKLLPVRVTPAVDAPERALELVVGPLRVRFEGGTTPAYVAAVARALMDAAS
jgi:hypothetical protein